MTIVAVRSTTLEARGSEDGPLDAERLSDRAIAVAKLAERLARTLDQKVDDQSGKRRLRAIVLTGLWLAALGVAAGCLESYRAGQVVWAVAATALLLVLVGVAAIGMFDVPSAFSDRAFATSLADAVLARTQAIMARRIDKQIANVHFRRELPVEAWTIGTSLLERAEEEIAGIERRLGFAGTNGGATYRRDQRIVPRQVRTHVTMPDGRRLAARIQDLSISGVAIETDLPSIVVGSAVTIGTRSARAVRKLSHGMAFVFDVPLMVEKFDANVVL